jgi:hypothetical protein
MERRACSQLELHPFKEITEIVGNIGRSEFIPRTYDFAVLVDAGFMFGLFENRL